MLAASGVGSTYSLDAADFPALIGALAAGGRTVVGPTVRDGAIVYDAVSGVDDLPVGWTSVHDAGRYRLERRSDRALFGFTVGPHAWRRFLDPPRGAVFRARRAADGTVALVAAEGAAPRYAFLGVRPCDLAAIAIQDRVHLDGPWPDSAYAERRGEALLVAVQCTEPAATCFCASLDSGPTATQGFDLALTEIVEGDRHVFLVEPGSERGSRLAASLPVRDPRDEDVRLGEERIARATASMVRTLDAEGLREKLALSYESPRWESIAARCFGCANCTLVCPTCFCTTVEDRAGLDGREIDRQRRWESCFTLGFSHIHGGSHRTTIASRYRQWLTHKLSAWHDQFGTSGCVGCGRCITWCPAAIDITEEARALTATED